MKKIQNRKIKIMIAFVILAIICIAAYFIFIYNKPNEEIHINPEDIPVFSDILLADNIDDSNLDSDYDGLLNNEELALNTDPYSPDTDLDGISDYDEINITKTNPLIADTDKDGLYDGIEVAIGLNPLKSKTDGKTKDFDRKFDKSFTYEQCELKVSGNADISSIIVQTVSDCNIKSRPGVISDLYEFYMPTGRFDSAIVSIKYDKNIPDENLSLFQFTNDGSFIEVPSVIDKETKTVKAPLEHFSKYVIGDKTIINAPCHTQVYVLIDNSGSMYPKSVVSTSDENDINFKRVDMAKDIINTLSSDDLFAVGKFTRNFSTIYKFNNDKQEALNVIENIRTQGEKGETFNGTYISSSARDAIRTFDFNHNYRKFLVILTDGESTELFDYSKDVIKEANAKNISIITIGLGADADFNYLFNLSSNTGGEYIYASNPFALENVTDCINNELNYNYVDTNKDGKNDEIIIADSNFDVKKDGFNFINYRIIPAHANNDNDIINGQCYGLANFVNKYYTKTLNINYKAVKQHKQNSLQSNASTLKDATFFTTDNKKVIMNQNLHDYKFINLFNDMSFWDRYTYEKDEMYMRFSDKARKLINDCPIIDYRTYTSSQVYVAENSGKSCKYTKYDKIIYNIKDVDYNSLSSQEKEMYNFLCTVNNLYSRQFTDEERDLFSSKSTESEFILLQNILKSGEVPLLHGEGHAVNAIRLQRDIDNPNLYTLYLYDNNYPDVEKRVTILRQSLSLFDKTSSAYWGHEYKYIFTDIDGVFNKTGKTIDVEVSELK